MSRAQAIGCGETPAAGAEWPARGAEDTLAAMPEITRLRFDGPFVFADARPIDAAPPSPAPQFPKWPPAISPARAELLADTERAVRTLEGGGEHVLAFRPDALGEVIAALESASADKSLADWRRRDALVQLARIERARALALAETCLDDVVLAPVARPLLRFPDLVALVRCLRDAGLPVRRAAEYRALKGRGKWRWLPTEDVLETGAVAMDASWTPHEHAARRLAELAAPLLDDVAFVQIEAWPFPEPYEQIKSVLIVDPPTPEQLPLVERLRAYDRGEWIEVLVHDPEEGLSSILPALGLLNTLSVRRGSDLRFCALAGGGDDTCARVLAASGAAIERGVAAGALMLLGAEE